MIRLSLGRLSSGKLTESWVLSRNMVR
ncbi:hypothetical protein LINPERPRIM_LOCUS4168 [Linum perenne]